LDLIEEPIDDRMEALPRRLAVALVAHDQRIAGIELLIEHVAAGELRADEIPGELVELVARDRFDRGRAPPAFERSAERRIGHHVDRSRHQERDAAKQRAQHVDDLGVMLLAPVERRIHDATIGRGVTSRPLLERLDLARDQPADRGLERRESAERLAYGWDLVGAVRLADAA